VIDQDLYVADAGANAVTEIDPANPVSPSGDVKNRLSGPREPLKRTACADGAG